MFDLGFSELLMTAVIALVVLGPERLPKAARFVGLWVRRARAQWHSVRSELERELAAEDLKRGLDEGRGAMRDLERSIRAHGDAAQDEVRRLRDGVAEGLPLAGSTQASDPPVAITPSDGRDDGPPVPPPSPPTAQVPLDADGAGGALATADVARRSDGDDRSR